HFRCPTSPFSPPQREPFLHSAGPSTELFLHSGGLSTYSSPFRTGPSVCRWCRVFSRAFTGAQERVPAMATWWERGEDDGRLRGAGEREDRRPRRSVARRAGRLSHRRGAARGGGAGAAGVAGAVAAPAR